MNAVAYNADLDQVALSSPNFSEIWIIDHSTTTAEARGHTGGRWGKGGDILYRWGNPRAYRGGTADDRRLFFQHNIQWIPRGCPGEGHLLVFNNGGGRKPQEYSSVDEIVPPIDKDGNYIRMGGGHFGPAEPLWSYTAPDKKDFFSWFISGAQRLPSGNTLINAGAYGLVFEVTPEGETVWKFANPFKPTGGAPPNPNGAPKRSDAAAAAKGNAQEKSKDQREPVRQRAPAATTPRKIDLQRGRRAARRESKATRYSVRRAMLSNTRRSPARRSNPARRWLRSGRRPKKSSRGRTSECEYEQEQEQEQDSMRRVAML